MKFKIKKKTKKESIEVNVPFDSGLLRELTVDENGGIFTIAYDADGLNLNNPFPFVVADSLVVAKLTDSNVYLSSILYVEENTIIDNTLLADAYESIVESEIYMSDKEKINLLLTFTNMLSKKSKTAK